MIVHRLHLHYNFCEFEWRVKKRTLGGLTKQNKSEKELLVHAKRKDQEGKNRRKKQGKTLSKW